MIPKTAKVQFEKKDVGEVKFNHYETVAEAQHDLGDEKLLKLLNVQVKTSAMNDHRRKFMPQEGKQALRNKAIARVTIEEWGQAAGDQEKIDALIEKYVGVLQNEQKAALQAAGGSAANGNSGDQEAEAAQAEADAATAETHA
jgi:hypothetical protein